MEIFFSNFWPILLASATILSLLQWGRHRSLDGTAAVFVRGKSFRELSAFSTDQQQRILHQADSQAFPRWRFFVPVLIEGTVISASVALSQTLPKITGLPDGRWATIGLAVLACSLFMWLAWLWEVRRIKPFLKNEIEKGQYAA